MSKESYARGFCKVAEAHGVDPTKLAKYAYDQRDVDAYKKSVTDAGNEAAQYLTEQEKTQPLPSAQDIREAFEWAKMKESAGGGEEMLERVGKGNPLWWSRFRSSLDQDLIMPKEGMKDSTTQALRALANVVRGQAVRTGKDHGGYWNHRDMPESVFRGAWPAFTNAINFGSAPVRPKTQRIVAGK